MLAFNIDPRPEAVNAMMPMVAAALGSELGDAADAEALQTFLARPGRLGIRSADPARVIPWFHFLDAALLGRNLNITATPGAATLADQMRVIAPRQDAGQP